jgi:hypothetical protein
MSTTNTFLGDVLRQTVDSGVTPLSHNPDVLNQELRADSARLSRDQGEAWDDFQFQKLHGMSRKLHAERNALWEREARETEILAPVEGEPPASVPHSRNLPKARAAYFRMAAWLQMARDELAELERAKTRLDEMIAAPTKAGETVSAKIKSIAGSLIASFGLDRGDSVDAAVEAERERIELEATARAASAAMPEIVERVEVKAMQVKRLEERLVEFHAAAVDEAYAGSGIEAIVAAAERRLERLKETASEFRSDIAADLERDTEAVIRLPRGV